MSDAENEPALDLVSRLVPATLKGLHALEFAGRHVSPTALPQLIDAMKGRDDAVKAALADLAHAHLARPAAAGAGLPRACRRGGRRGIAALRSAADEPQPIVAAYRGLRNYARAAQAIYPLAAFFRPISQFFLEQAARDDAELLARLATVDPGRDKVGVMHAGGPPGTRGAFSLYVPETYDEGRAYPLGGGAAWRQRQRRRLPVELGARSAHARLHRAGADGDRLDLVVDGSRHRRAQHRSHGRSGRRRVEQSTPAGSS